MKNYLLYLFLCFLVISCYEETEIPVTGNFSIEYLENNQSVPVQVKINNQTEGAEAYQWTFEGGTPSSSTKKDPGTITYETPGDHKITLVASNQDGSKDTKEMIIHIYDAIAINFTAQIINNQANYPPAKVQITNQTQGVGLSYSWTFEGGNPSSSKEKDPPVVTFSTPGEHKISLTVNNGTISKTATQTVTVAENITSDFSWNVSVSDDDYQVPVTLNMVNNSKSATSYSWTFDGGTPASSTEKQPVITYKTLGTYTIKLKTDNGSSSAVSEKKITVYADTNLRTFTDIKLGINSAHTGNSVGAFFSTVTHEVYSANQVSSTVGKDIDLVFFGLGSTFTYNKFISPDKASENGFLPIPNATHTIFVNSQEVCNCGLNFTSSAFDSMTNDTPLKSLSITETPAGMQQFNSSVPRVVLFKTQDGRKGAIKIKQMVANGINSYIVCDIKVQKVSK